MKALRLFFASHKLLLACLVVTAVVGAGVIYGSISQPKPPVTTSSTESTNQTDQFEDDSSTGDTSTTDQEVSYDDAYSEFNALVTISDSYYFGRRITAIKANTQTTTTTPITNPAPDPEPTPDPIYYTVTRTGAYKYTPAEVEAGVAAANPSYFTRNGNTFTTTLKSGTYGGGYSQPGDYFYLNELYYQINFNSSLTFLTAGTQLTYKNQTIDFYVDSTLAIQWVLAEETNNPGTEFYVTKQYNLDPDYLWNTGAYGQVQGGPYVFDPVDIVIPYSCSGC